MSFEALRDVERFAALTDSARGVLTADVARQLGPEWAAKESETQAVMLVHVKTDIEFVVVPGGEFEMGLQEGDIDALKAAIGWSPEIAETLATGRDHVSPAHQVSVRPFVLSCDTLSYQEVEALSEGRHQGMYCYQLERNEAQTLARTLGLRLPSEAELEWVMREGGQSHFAFDASRKLDTLGNDTEEWPTRFGIVQPFGTCWCADDYHEGYVGAPSVSEPWMNGEPDGVARPSGAEPELVEEPEQRIGLLACWRTARGHTKASIRFAHDLVLT